MTIRVFASGQSNMVGSGTGGPNWASIDSRVRVWNNVNPLGANGNAFVSASAARTSGTFQFTDRNNLAVWFCHRLALHENDTIDMVMVARSGTQISAWEPGSAIGMLEECISVWSATSQAPAHIFLWHQGEGNTSTPSSEYIASFFDLLTNLKLNNIINDSTIVILGGTAEVAGYRINFNRNSLQQIAAQNDKCFYAPSDGLLTYDNTHFTGDSLYSFGAERDFNAYVKAKGIGMVDIWAQVNENGTPGVTGSGTSKIANIGPVLTQGFRQKGPPIVMTTDQTYVPSEGTRAILVEAVGAGGGGGGGQSTGGVARVGGGGGGGGYVRKWIENPEASYAVEVGTGGAGGNATTGGAGSKDTKFGLALTASRGSGGLSSGTVAVQAFATGGGGGAATGGDLNVPGKRGFPGQKMADTARLSGEGGFSAMGTGGQPLLSTSTSTSANGLDAVGYGGGGGGALSSTTSDAVGGAGTGGVVIVTEYQRG